MKLKDLASKTFWIIVNNGVVDTDFDDSVKSWLDPQDCDICEDNDTVMPVQIVTTNWSYDLPTVPGSYWFYGKPFGHGKDRMALVEVIQGEFELVYQCGTFTAFPSKGGMFTPVVFPRLP